MKRSGSERQSVARFFFLIYALVMLWLLFGRNNRWTEGMSYRQLLESGINLKPFYTIGNYWYVIVHRTNDSVLMHCIINLLGNVLLFIPLGWWLPRIFKAQRRFLLFFITCLLFDLLVETVQLLTLLGSFDIDDVILNMTGFLLGFGLFKLFFKDRKQK